MGEPTLLGQHDVSDKDSPTALELRVHYPVLHYLGLLLTVLVWKQTLGYFLNTCIKQPPLSKP